MMAYNVSNIGAKLCKNIYIRRAISSGNPEELDIIWQPQIKRCGEKLSRYMFNK